MAIFVRTQAGDTTVYTNKTTSRQVKAEDLDPAVKEELDLADFNTEIDDETVTKGEGDGVVDANGNPVNKDKAENEAEEEAAPAPRKPAATRTKKPADLGSDDANEVQAEAEQRINPYRRDVPQTEKGFGFPRKNGKTVDLFDGKTPHTQVRSVAGMMVPLNEENYRTKTDAEIYDRLDELKLV